MPKKPNQARATALSGKLPPKELKFVLKFITNGFNATKAYKSAGYKPKTDGSARSAAARLLARVHIQDEIKKRMSQEEDKLEEEYSITKDSIRRELALIGFSNMKKVATWTGNRVTMKDSEEMTDDEAALLDIVRNSESSSSEGSSESFSLKMHNKVKCLELLGKSVGLFDGMDSDGSDEDQGSGEDIEAEISRTIESLKK